MHVPGCSEREAAAPGQSESDQEVTEAAPAQMVEVEATKPSKKALKLLEKKLKKGEPSCAGLFDCFWCEKLLLGVVLRECSEPSMSFLSALGEVICKAYSTVPRFPGFEK